MVQLLSGTILDDLAATYISAIENFERVALSVSSELGAGVQSVENPLIPDASATVTPGNQLIIFFGFALDYLVITFKVASCFPAYPRFQ